MKRKIVSILLSTMLLFSLMPAMAFAEGGFDEPEQSAAGLTDAEDTDMETAIIEANDLTVEDVADTPSENAHKLVAVAANGWSDWSEWQDDAVSGSSTREVETRSVVASYRMSSYCYTDYSCAIRRGYWPSASQPAANLRRGTEETWPKEWVDSARWVISANTYYDSPDNDNCDGMVHDQKAYVCVHGQGHDYVPFFIIGTNYKTQYRYRDKKAEPEKPSAVPSDNSGTDKQEQNTEHENIDTTPAGCETDPKIETATITWEGSDEGDGYQIEYSTSSKYKNSKKVKVKGRRNCRHKLTGLKPGTTYYIRIRVYVVVKGKVVYRKWGKTCKMKTYSKKGNMSGASWAGIKKCKYTGKATKQSFQIILNGITLKEGTDYKVSYRNNKKVGTATVIVKGCGRYFGSIRKNYKIVPAGTSLVNCLGGKQKVTVKWKKRSKNCSGYQVRYCTRADFKGCKTKTIKGKGNSRCTLNGLSAGTVYYIEIRIYYIVGKTKYYSSWSKCKTVSTGKSFSTKAGTVYRTIKIGNYVYCGSGGDIYKVNVKTRKAKRFLKNKTLRVMDFSVYKGYLYYIDYGYSYGNPSKPPYRLYKVSLKTGKKQYIVNAISYYIKGGKIYYASYTKDNDTSVGKYEWNVGPWICMDIDGNNKVSLNVTGPQYEGNSMRCNVNGYNTITVEGDSSVKGITYLQMPNGKSVRLSQHYVETGVLGVWVDEQWYAYYSLK